MKKLVIVLCSIFLTVVAVKDSQAVLVEMQWDMQVTFHAFLEDLSDNRYGLGVGDVFEASVIYDDSSLFGSGEEYIYFDGDTNKMDFNPSSIPKDTFNETAAVNPYIKFVDGSPQEISYSASVWVTQSDLSLGSGGYPSDPDYGLCRLVVHEILHLTDPNYGREYDCGFIISDVWGYLVEGTYTNFSMNPAPVPEPSTILLVATGLIGLVGFRKKFKK